MRRGSGNLLRDNKKNLPYREVLRRQASKTSPQTTKRPNQLLTCIPPGAFIALYTGAIIPEKIANTMKGDDQYFEELGYLRSLRVKSEESESELSEMSEDSELEYSDSDTETAETHRRVTRSSSSHKALLRRRIMPHEWRKYNDKKDVFIIDAKHKGNVARFIDHSCEPNTFTQFVFIDTHDLRLPSLAIFAADYIWAGTEITRDYGYELDDNNKILCVCERTDCIK